MGEAIGESITFAIGVATSPIPIMAIILMLLFQEGRRQQSGLCRRLGDWRRRCYHHCHRRLGGHRHQLGRWTVPRGLDRQGRARCPLAVHRASALEGTARPRVQASLPRWLQAIEGIAPVKSGALGIGLSAVNPKNLIMIVGGAGSPSPVLPRQAVGRLSPLSSSWCWPFRQSCCPLRSTGSSVTGPSSPSSR